MNPPPSQIEQPARAGAAEALAILEQAARLGGEIAMRDFRRGEMTSASIEHKSGGSPVTSADMAVDRFLKERLGAAFPDAAWLSEETADDEARLSHSRLIVVDPIDGTRAFLTGDPRWTVSIALVDDGRPIAGVVHAPALAETFIAFSGGGARFNGVSIHASDFAHLDGARVAGPRPLVQAFAAAARADFPAQAKIPSLAYRLALVANGGFDLALASINAHDWDIAAADVILAEAGARLSGVDGESLIYNRLSARRDPLLAAPLPWVSRLSRALGEALSARRHET